MKQSTSAHSLNISPFLPLAQQLSPVPLPPPRNLSSQNLHHSLPHPLWEKTYMIATRLAESVGRSVARSLVVGYRELSFGDILALVSSLPGDVVCGHDWDFAKLGLLPSGQTTPLFQPHHPLPRGNLESLHRFCFCSKELPICPLRFCRLSSTYPKEIRASNIKSQID